MPVFLASAEWMFVEVYRFLLNFMRSIALAAVIMMPTLGYLDQLNKMISAKSSQYFDMDTALILLFTNFLRFIYWVFEPFEIYLLGQAIAVFATQLCLAATFFYFEYSSHEKVGFGRHHHHRSLKYLFGIRRAGNIYDFAMSLWFYGLVILFAFVFFSLLFGRDLVCTAIIVIANVVDTFVSIPQFIRVVIEKNVESVSSLLVGQYLIGDIMKLLLFLWTRSPWPFVFGAVLQTGVDSIVAISYFVQTHNRGSGGGDEKNEEMAPLL